MWIRNNSDQEWLQYNCGKEVIDIKAHSIFEVSEETGTVLLRLLGCKQWLTKAQESDPTIEPDEGEPIAEVEIEKPKKKRGRPKKSTKTEAALDLG